MSKKILLLLAVIYLTFYGSLASASDWGYEPNEVIVRFAPKANGLQRTVAERNDALAAIVILG